MSSSERRVMEGVGRRVCAGGCEIENAVMDDVKMRKIVHETNDNES
jgi:hypothetical protein